MCNLGNIEKVTEEPEPIKMPVWTVGPRKETKEPERIPVVVRR